MLLIEEIIGNIHQDESLANTYEEYETDGRLERIVLDETERKRSRLRTTTDRGTDIGIVVDRSAGLSPGDVVVCDDECMVVITEERQETLVIELDRIDDVAAALECGHRLGNQHRTLAVDEGRMYIPVGEESAHVDRIIERTLGEIPTEYERVNPSRFDRPDRPTEHNHHRHHSHDC